MIAHPDSTMKAVPPAANPAKISDVKTSPFRFVTPAIIAILLGLIGFAVAKWLIMPRFSKQTVTLTYWGLWEPEAVVAPAIAKFESDHPNIKINYQMQSKTDYRQRLQSALARGEGPDVMRFHETWGPMLKDELEPAPTEFFSAEEFKKTFYPEAVQSLVQGNRVIGVPLMTEGLGLFVNNEIMAATDSGVPKTWDELRKVAFALTKRDGKGKIIRSGVAMGTTNNITHWPDILAVLMLQNSVDLAKPNATVDARGRNLGADALRFYTIFNLEDRVWDKALPPDVVAFASGRLAMMIAPSWEVHEIIARNSQLDFSIYPIPQLNSQRKVAWASSWVEGVSLRSQHKQESWQFLKFLTTPEALQLMYSETAKTRAFGEPYPRPDMASTLSAAKYVGAYIQQAPDAKSWYMSSRTGDSGLNDEIIDYYETAINSILDRKSSPEAAIDTVAKGVSQVLIKFGLIVGTAPAAKK